jgi:hypothetical protein
MLVKQRCKLSKTQADVIKHYNTVYLPVGSAIYLKVRLGCFRQDISDWPSAMIPNHFKAAEH